MRQIEHLRGNAHAQLLAELLPDLESKQINRAIDNLLRNGRIERNGTTEILVNRWNSKINKEVSLYIARPNWEPAQNYPHGKASKSPPKRRSPPPLLPQTIPVANLRARKVECLRRLLDRCIGDDRDLVIGILADYGCIIKTRAS